MHIQDKKEKLKKLQENLENPKLKEYWGMFEKGIKKLESEIAESVNEDTKKRFDVYFYKANGDRQTSQEEIIRGDKFSDIVSQATKVAKLKGMNYVEFYYKDSFIGSIDKSNGYEFKKGRDSEKSPLSINEAKPKATEKAKPKAQGKTRGRKKTTLSLADAEKQLAEKVGKTEEECEDIIKQFKELRAKKKARIKKTSETKAKSKAQGETEKSGEITPEAVIERATEKVQSKIEKKIEKVENKAEETEKPKEKATPQAKKEAEKKVEKKVEKATQKVADESSDALKQMIKSVFDAIKKYDKQVGKAELIKLRDEIDKMIATYSDGGMVQNYDIQASLINVGNNPNYAKGGSMASGGEINGKYLDSISADKKSKILNNIAKHYGISSKEAEEEVVDLDAENLFEYIANDNSLRMQVYNDFKTKYFAKGGSTYAEGGGVKTNSKSVREAIRKEILDSVYDENEEEFDNFNDASQYLADEFKRVADYPSNMRNIPNNQDRFQDYLAGLPFRFEYENYKIEEFLNGLGINPKGKKYTSDQMQKLYSYLIWREISDKYNNYAKGGSIYQGGGEIDVDVVKAIFDSNEMGGQIQTSRGKKSLDGLISMMGARDLDSETIAKSIFTMNSSNGKVSTYWGEKTLKGLTSMIQRARESGGLTYQGGGEIKRENDDLMGYEPYFEKNVSIASIDEESKTIRPTHGYFPNHPHSKKAIAWAKRNGYKYIADGKTYQGGGELDEVFDDYFNYNIGGAIAMLGQAKEVAPETMGTADSYLANKIKNQQKMDDWWNTPPNQRMAEGGKVSREFATKEIPMSLYKSFFSDSDGDGVPNVDDVEPLNATERERLEEVSLSDEMKTIINYRNDFEKVRKEVVDDLGSIITECGGKGECTILSRTKTPYSIINKLRRRSLTNVKDLDLLDKEAKNKLKNKDLTGLDLYKGLTDVVGTMIVTPDKKNLDKVRDAIKSGKVGEVLEFEDFYANPNNGYRAYHFLISVKKDGVDFPVEIQVKTSRVKKLSDFAHTLYKTGNLNPSGFDKLNKMALESDMGDEEKAKEFDALISNQNKVIELISNQKMAQGGELGNISQPYNIQEGLISVGNNVKFYGKGGGLESVVNEGKTSAVYTDPKTGKEYDLQYVSSKKRWELDIMKKGASIYSNAITTIKRNTLAEIQEWLDGYKIDSSWTKSLESVNEGRTYKKGGGLESVNEGWGNFLKAFSSARAKEYELEDVFKKMAMASKNKLDFRKKVRAWDTDGVIKKDANGDKWIDARYERAMKPKAVNEAKTYKKGGGLYDNLKIKKGTFTSKAENRGMTAKAFMKEVLSNPENYTLKTRRQAQLMKNMMS
jgi:hypothetical protein